MRVLHVITGLAAGGAEQQLALLLRHTRHQAEVVSLTGVGTVGRRIAESGTPVHALRMSGNRDARALPRLAALMRGGQYDVVHAHLYRACVYGRGAARLAGIERIVATEHSIGDTLIEGRPKTRGTQLLYLATERLSQRTVAVSDAVRERLVAWGVPPRRIEVIPNGLDTEAFAFDAEARRDARGELGLDADARVIGSVGRLHPVKRLDGLIAAAAPLLRDGAQLLLVGEGAERERLRATARALGVAEQVRMPGERPDVARMLAAMDVYAAPSAEETFGLAALEALASGLPVVVGQCPAVEGLDLPQIRRLGRPGDLPRALAEAVAGLSAEHAADASRATPPELAERYDIKAVADAVDGLYERLPPRRAARRRRRGGPAAEAGNPTAAQPAREVARPDSPLTIERRPLAAVAAEWDELADRVGASPFTRPGWVAAWCAAFGAEPLEVVCAREGDRLVGALPLLRKGRRLRSPTNHETPGFGAVLADARAAEAMVGAVLDDRPRSVDLGYLDAHGATAAGSADAARARGYELCRVPQLDSPVIDLSGGWEAYERQLSSKRRSGLRRRRRRLEERGAVALEFSDGREGLETLLEEGFAVEASGWKGREGTAVACDPRARRFYSDVARWAADRGLLRLAFLRLDGAPIAFSLALAQGETHYGLKIGYDENFRSLSPGLLLLRELLRDAVAAGGTSYHCLGSAEGWKSEWAEGTTSRVRHVMVARSSPFGQLAKLGVGYGTRLPRPAKDVLRRLLWV